MEEIVKLLEELALQQTSRMKKLAHRYNPRLSEDDLLQPNDFEELESDPEFRYEEGVRAGILSSLAAIRAAINA